MRAAKPDELAFFFDRKRETEVIARRLEEQGVSCEVDRWADRTWRVLIDERDEAAMGRALRGTIGLLWRGASPTERAREETT